MAGRCILGVDPGSSGAIAFFWPDSPSVVAAEDVPTVGGALDPVTLAAKLRLMQPAAAIVEQVSAMPKQGVSSTFKFGMAYGQAIGVIAALSIPMHLAAPGRWKKHFRLSADKEEARALALRFWPGQGLFERKKDHGRAEAALIARFGVETGLV
ncbi:hypothetical protein [Bosea sp. (in: a-proteobacteria)]|uniref:hypothetical protein n=1 Tax=Bosea sp. (in: a-proteobacteria) TaxID=1871050 RepID=UPI003B3B0E8C